MKQNAKLTCQETVELVTGYLEYTLLPEMDAHVEAHLATCPGCQTYLDQMRQTIRLLRDLTAETGSSQSKQQALEKFQAWRKINKDKGAT